MNAEWAVRSGRRCRVFVTEAAALACYRVQADPHLYKRTRNGWLLICWGNATAGPSWQERRAAARDGRPR